MGFMTYCLDYYREKLHVFEREPAAPETVYLARQLLKMLDDLEDEGYTELSQRLETEFRGVGRLKACLEAWGAKPFALIPPLVAESDLLYEARPRELNAFLQELEPDLGGEANPFIPELHRFCRWLGGRQDTAYVFLLRDTLLPYLFCKKSGMICHPWLLGRKMAGAVSGNPFVDDRIRGVIMEALEAGLDRDFSAFRAFCTPKIREITEEYPPLADALARLLQAIPQKKILVVESGCYGTFPMLLAALDDRVDFVLYTTVPFMAELYRDRIFTPAYENNRLFETLYAQDRYFRFADFRDGRFYVQECRHPLVKKAAQNEIGQMLAGNGENHDSCCANRNQP